MNDSSSNKKLAAILAGLGVVGFGIYFLVKNRSAAKNAKVVNTVDVAPVDSQIVNNAQITASMGSESKIFVKEREYFDALNRLKPEVDADLKKGQLSKKTIMGVNKLMLQLIQKDYLRSIQESRQMRRKYIGSIPDYVRELMEGSTKSEQLIEEGSLVVFKDLNISPELYEMECERINMEDPQFAFMSLYLLESIKNQIPSKLATPFDKQLALKVFRYQNEAFDQYSFDELPGIAPEQSMMLKQSYLGDLTALKFGVEEEDLMKNPTLIIDPEIVELQKQFQAKMFKDQQNFINFPY